MKTTDEMLPEWVQKMTKYSKDGIKELMIEYAKESLNNFNRILSEEGFIDYRTSIRIDDFLGEFKKTLK